MHNINPLDRVEQRRFGWQVGLAIIALGVLRQLLRLAPGGAEPGIPWWWLTIGAILVFLGFVVPAILGPILVVWLRIAIVLNWLMTRILLGIVFFGMMFPAGIIIKILGDDPLKRKWETSASTYWEDPEEQPEDPERYYNQF